MHARGLSVLVRWAHSEGVLSLPPFCSGDWGANPFNLQASRRSPSTVEVRGVWLALWGQQLQEEEMETLHCHQASVSAKEQLIPEAARRGKRLSKDSRRKRQTNSNSQPPLGQGVVCKQPVTGE